MDNFIGSNFKKETVENNLSPSLIKIFRDYSELLCHAKDIKCLMIHR
uniref:Uncharacterized protein n=1 Tax=Rhizophora mucronata TaxID=61149 RepID=A0A2P2P6W1_RHIMU